MTEDIQRYYKNVDRALIAAYSIDEDIEEFHVSDLLADIMHYCRVTEINFERVLRVARNHFKEELIEITHDFKNDTPENVI